MRLAAPRFRGVAHEPITVPQVGSAPQAQRSLRQRIGDYKDLAKLEIFDVYLSVPLAWSLLPVALLDDPSVLGRLLLILIAIMGVVTAACAFDDVQGARDGTDAINYADAVATRSVKRKPVLDGRLSDRQALTYAYSAVGIGLLALVAAYAARDFSPWWIGAGYLVIALAAACYSWGPKLSYIGAQDLVVIGANATNLILIYALAVGEVQWPVVFQGFMLGSYLMALTAFANTNDIDGDRAAGRKTMAVRLSPRANARYNAGLVFFGWAVMLVGIVTGELPWWLLPLNVPALALQAAALRAVLRDDEPLKARAVGLKVYRLGWLSLFITNLIALAT